MPLEAKIDGFKKTVDFYFYMGIPCARMWPTLHITERAPSVRAQWPIFTYAVKEWGNLSPDIKFCFKTMASNSHLTARDFFMRAYISGIDYGGSGQAGNPAANSNRRFSLRSISHELTADTVIFRTITDVPATLTLHLCPHPAPRRRTIETRRGRSERGDMDWCVPTRIELISEEHIDALAQTFVVPLQEIVRYEADYFHGAIEDFISQSMSPIIFPTYLWADFAKAVAALLQPS